MQQDISHQMSTSAGKGLIFHMHDALSHLRRDIHCFGKDCQLAKPNYDFAKRQKELAKKAKKEEKRLRKLAAGEAHTEGESTDSADEASDEAKPETQE